jgi:hypothetical protein
VIGCPVFQTQNTHSGLEELLYDWEADEERKLFCQRFLIRTKSSPRGTLAMVFIRMYYAACIIKKVVIIT